VVPISTGRVTVAGSVSSVSAVLKQLPAMSLQSVNTPTNPCQYKLRSKFQMVLLVKLMVIDPLKQYIATIKTEKGDIVVELIPDVAPMTVNSFVFLAGEGWFDNVTFHRVLPGFMAQGGDPSGSGMGGPGYAFKNEISPDLSFDREGLLAMANSGPDTNGSQF